MQKWHCASPNAATKPVANDHLVAGAQCINKRVELREIVTVVGVGHDHESPTGCVEPAYQRAAVALLCNRHDSRAGFESELRRPVAGTVVGDQHLTIYSNALEKSACLAHARLDGFGLVEARHEDSQFHARDSLVSTPSSPSAGHDDS